MRGAKFRHEKPLGSDLPKRANCPSEKKNLIAWNLNKVFQPGIIRSFD